jgi:hypothetical protein
LPSKFISDSSYKEWLLGKPPSTKNYPIQNQKQIRKYWKDLEAGEKELQCINSVEETYKRLERQPQRHLTEERRIVKLFNLIKSLEISGEITQEELTKEVLRLLRTTDDSKFIDSVLFPTLDEIGSFPRLSLHFLGKNVYKTISDLNFNKLIKELEKKEGKEDAKSNMTKQKSQATKSGKVNSNQEMSNANGTNKKSILKSGSKENDKKLSIPTPEKNQTTLDEEKRKISRDLLNGIGATMIGGKGDLSEKKKQKRRKTKDFTQYSVCSQQNNPEHPKATSLRNEDHYANIRRTNSTTNEGVEEHNTLSYNQTVSTKTESRVPPSQALTNLYSRQEFEVREENDDLSNDSISVKSKKGSVDHNQNTSVDFDEKNARTNSFEKKGRKKFVNKGFFTIMKQGEEQGAKIKKAGRDTRNGKTQLINLYGDNRKQKQNSVLKPVAIHPVKQPTKTEKLIVDEIDKQNEIEVKKTRKNSGNKNLEDISSPLLKKVISKNSHQGPTTDNKIVYGATLKSVSKWEVEDSTPKPKDKTQKSGVMAKPVFENEAAMTNGLKTQSSIKSGFQKYLSETTALEQGELFFKNYLNSSVLECISRINSGVKQREPLRSASYFRVLSVINQSFRPKKTSVKVYGSWVTGLMADQSDIDLTIVKHEISERSEGRRMLEVLEANLKNFAWVKETKGIYSAMVPVLKLVRD